MKNFTSRKILTGLIVATVIALILYFVAFFSIRSKTRSLSLLEADLQVELLSEERSRSMKKLVEDTKTQRAALNTFFVSDDGVASFISDLESTAASARVDLDITSVGVEDISADETLLELLTLRFSAEGTWQEVVHFVSLLELMPHALSIRSSQLQRSVRGEEIVWQGAFNVSVLKLKE